MLDAARIAGVEIISLCGGEGLCNSCKVRWLAGIVNPLTLAEKDALSAAEQEGGYRLACQALPQSDCRVEVPPESLASPQRLQLEGDEPGVEIDLPVKFVDLRIAAPKLSDLRSDSTRLIGALREAGVLSPRIGFPLLSALSDQIRSLDWQARAVLRPGSSGG